MWLADTGFAKIGTFRHSIQRIAFCNVTVTHWKSCKHREASHGRWQSRLSKVSVFPGRLPFSTSSKDSKLCLVLTGWPRSVWGKLGTSSHCRTRCILSYWGRTRQPNQGNRICRQAMESGPTPTPVVGGPTWRQAEHLLCVCRGEGLGPSLCLVARSLGISKGPG